MLKTIVFAACLVVAGPAFAQQAGSAAPQTPTLTGPQLAIQQTAMAFGQCVQTGAQGLAATVAPEAGAHTIVGACGAQKQQLEAAALSYIATLPEDQRAGAQENLRTHLGGIEAQIADAIRQQRTAAATPPAPPAATTPAQ